VTAAEDNVGEREGASGRFAVVKLKLWNQDNGSAGIPLQFNQVFEGIGPGSHEPTVKTFFSHQGEHAGFVAQ